MLLLFNPPEQLQGEHAKRLGSNLGPNVCFLGWRDVWLRRLTILFEFSFVCVEGGFHAFSFISFFGHVLSAVS